MNDKTNNTQEGGEHRNAIGRRRRIYVRVTENELTRIRSRACKAGMSISAYTRMKTLEDQEARPTVDLDIAELRKAFADLKHAGSNLNQCARALNTFGADEDSAANTDRAVRRVSAAADNICALIAAVRS